VTVVLAVLALVHHGHQVLALVHGIHICRWPAPASRAALLPSAAKSTRRASGAILAAMSRQNRGRIAAGGSSSAGRQVVDQVPAPQQTIAVNRQIRGLKQIHSDPDIYVIKNFLDTKTCEAFRTVGSRGEQDGSAKRVSSKVFGPGLSAGSVMQGLLAATAGVLLPTTLASLGRTRRSTTWFLNFGRAAPLIRSVLSLFPDAKLENCEEPQVVRYEDGDYFDWHQDALPAEQARRAANGGQRVATVIVYLNDMNDREGGATAFRDLPVTIRPEQGKAVVFFPAFADGTPDPRTVHAGKPVTGEKSKWIAQLWVHQGTYVPSVPPGNSHSDFVRSGLF